MGETSGTGVAFTRNPSTGEKGIYGEYLINAQGEDVVAGVRTPQPISKLAEDLPKCYKQFMETGYETGKPLPRYAGYGIYNSGRKTVLPADT